MAPNNPPVDGSVQNLTGDAPEVPQSDVSETAPAESGLNSPEKGESQDSPAEQPPTEQPEAPSVLPSAAEVSSVPEPEPPTFIVPPTEQPPIPGGMFFNEHGSGTDLRAAQPKEFVIYVSADGRKQRAEVAARRPDGAIDILLPNGVGQFRRDGIRRRESNDQVGDYFE